MSQPTRLQVFVQNLSHFPWRNTALTLRERFREDRLGLTASSLTFTTIIALVPLVTVALAVFTAFPMFGKLQEVLQKWLVESLIPDNIARQVLGYLTQFAGKASRLGSVSLAVLFITALSLIFTIDRTLNAIWRVRRPRPLGQRLLIYWAAITLGPLLLAGSLAITSYLLTASRGLVGVLPGGLRFLLDLLEFLLVAGGMTATYYYVPNTQVKWGHAWAGGLFAAAGIEVAKKVLAIYVKAVPTYSAVYGAFATVPWVIVLLGAVITAYLPSLLMGVSRRSGAPGWEFTLALDTLAQLLSSGQAGRRGLSAQALAEALRVDPVQLEAVLGTLVALDWVGRLEDGDGRYVLLVDPESASLGPLIDRLLLAPSPRTAFMTINGMKATSTLGDALQTR